MAPLRRPPYISLTRCHPGRRDQFRFSEIVDSDADFIGDATARYAKRTARIIDSYVARFGTLKDRTSVRGAVETMLLSIVGLFDRPAEQIAVDAVLAEPHITELTDALNGLSAAQRRARLHVATKRLQGLKLLNSAGTEGPLDAHPVVRAHFGARLKNDKPAAFKEANRRLYGHYKAQPDKEFPDSLPEMQPLFHAIGHGVAAGEAQAAFDEVYVLRVRRRHEAYVNTQLGAYSSNLGALAHFFATPWSAPRPDLTAHAQLLAVNFAGFALRALGRLADAVAPFLANLHLHIQEKEWRPAAIAASNISELELMLGNVGSSVTAAQRRQSLSQTRVVTGGSRCFAALILRMHDIRRATARAPRRFFAKPNKYRRSMSRISHVYIPCKASNFVIF